MAHKTRQHVPHLLHYGLLLCGTVLIPFPAQAQATEAPSEPAEAELVQLAAGLQEPGAGAAGAQAEPVAPPRSPIYTPLPQERSDILVHFAGYADSTMALFDGEDDQDIAFTGAAFNPAIHVQYKDLILMEAEGAIKIDADGETEFELEYAQLDLFLHDSAVLIAGKFLSPVGQFQERLHPSWINRLPNAPPGFGHDGVQPGAEVGLQLRGGIPLGVSRFTYALAVGNGPRLDGAGGVMTEGFSRDDNKNKALSGRLGFLPWPYLEVGASFLTAKVRGPSGDEPADAHSVSFSPASVEDEIEGDFSEYSADYNLIGLDAAYTRGPWGVRFEYLRGVRDAIMVPGHEEGEIEVGVPRLKMTAWYGQIAYRLSGLTENRILGNFEPVVRYARFNVRGSEGLAEEAAERRLDLGLNYWFAPSIVLHGAVEWRKFTARHEDEKDRDTRLLFQLSYGF